jgi:cytolysin (calcineurin-like family phosphatase)
MMSKVQITPTRTNTVKPIRIHQSGVRCFLIISGLASGQPHDAELVYRCAEVSAFRNKTEEERGFLIVKR